MFRPARTTSSRVGIGNYSYDAAGNMLTDNANTYAYNAESEIKSAAGVTYTYDGDGNRLEKVSQKIYWYGAGTEILDESNSSGTFTNEYVFFGGKRVAMRNVSSGTIYYYEEDMLGTSRTMVQAGQTSVCYDADFYPFGGERDITNTCTQNYKFESKERDTETGNDDFGARYYTSRLGRWLSADWSAVPAPVPYANLTNPQTLNLYAIVSDNPETFADLDGHDGGGGICDVNRNGCPNSGQSTNAPPPTGGKDPKSNSPNTGTGPVGQSDAQRRSKPVSETGRRRKINSQSHHALPVQIHHSRQQNIRRDPKLLRSQLHLRIRQILRSHLARSCQGNTIVHQSERRQKRPPRLIPST